MGILEIVLLIAGVIIFTGSFFLPLGGEKNTGIDQKAAKEEIHGLVEEEMNNVRSKMQDKMGETSEDAIEKAERALERLTNEKIMAVNEYSDTVLQEIHKNHEEAMFLYDMLNSKHANIKDTVSKMDKAVKAAENKTLENKTAENKAAAEKTATDKTAGTVAEEKTADAFQTETLIQPENSPEIGFMGETVQEGQNNNEKILEMHKQGKSTVAIAKELGLGVGEVKLVIDLYKA
ncbi:DUF6115 domain-containing protein [Simiaoa sp.]|uniref:DUF6115 domain-containing protein n=1 Tax=Simiaoa sp. TaxID=2944202 RepID=UPI003F813C26